MNPSTTYLPAPEGPGSVSGAPNLPEGFTDASTSRYVDSGEVRLHAVVGGEGPQLLLVHGWPGNWYARRLAMPTLAALRESLTPGHGERRARWHAHHRGCRPGQPARADTEEGWRHCMTVKKARTKEATR